MKRNGRALPPGGETSGRATAVQAPVSAAGSGRAVNAGAAVPGDRFADKPNFGVTGLNAAILNRPIVAEPRGKFPLKIDRSSVRLDLGKLDIEGGLLDLSGKKSVAVRPLAVAAPAALENFAETGSPGRETARPIIRGSYTIDSSARVEGVFIPSFEGQTFVTNGHWAPAQVKEIYEFADRHYVPPAGVTIDYPDTDSLEYAQFGLRYSRSVGFSSIGFRYYYGNLSQPAVTAISVNRTKSLTVKVDYNRYHQVGADFSSVLGTCRVRSGLAANITEDLAGDDGSVYNPSVLWSVGFDRDLASGISVGAKGTGSVRLLDDRVGDTIADTEAGTDMTATTVTVTLSKKYLNDALEFGTAAFCGLEDADCALMPSLAWEKNGIEMELSGGIFAGYGEGELSQYLDRDYVKLALSCKF